MGRRRPDAARRRASLCRVRAPDGVGERRSRRDARTASSASSACRQPTLRERGAVRIHATAFHSRNSTGTASARCVTTTSSRTATVSCLGEFLLGYPNEYGLYTPRPLLDPQRDPDGLLPRAEDAPEQADLGRNGCYLVMRQLHQDVQGFWRELDRQAAGRSQACASGWPRRWWAAARRHTARDAERRCVAGGTSTAARH